MFLTVNRLCCLFACFAARKGKEIRKHELVLQKRDWKKFIYTFSFVVVDDFAFATCWVSLTCACRVRVFIFDLREGFQQYARVRLTLIP
jgi:hypothetical protein